MGPLWGVPGNVLVCAVCDGGKELSAIRMPRKEEPREDGDTQ
jgi:hypothetical protein